jgi:hydroxyacylglutathione hydrolase
VAGSRFAATVDSADSGVLAALEESRELRSRDEVTLPSTIGRERRINPFQRCREPAVKTAAEARAGRSISSVADVFAVVCSGKDGFR